MTPRKRALLHAILVYQNENNRPPTIREIMRMIGVSTPSVVSHHVLPLVEAGYLEKTPLISRGILLTAKGREFIEGDKDDEIWKNS